MKDGRTPRLLAGALLALAAAAAGEARAGDLSCPQGGTCAAAESDWRATGCDRPRPPPPPVARNDMAAWQASLERERSYLTQARTYLECLAHEADADLTAMQERMTARIEGERKSIEARAKRAARELELAKPRR